MTLQDHVWSRIERARKYEDQIRPEIDAYHAERRELSCHVRTDNGDLRLAHITVIASASASTF